MKNPMAYNIARKWYPKLFRDRHTMLLVSHPLIQALRRDRYHFKKHDALSKVAEAYYGNYAYFLAIALVNNQSNPDAIEPGTILQMPTPEEARDIWVWIRHKVSAYSL